VTYIVPVIQGCHSRKNEFPLGGVMVMLFVPLFVIMGSLFVVQLVVVKSAFCCRTNPVAGDGHEMTALLILESAMLNDGCAIEKEKSSNAKSFP